VSVNKSGVMSRLIVSVLIVLILSVHLAGCASSKKDYRERRDAMLLQTTQLGRNKGYYSKHKEKKIDHSYKKIVKKRKYD
jgi:hypothetical protein